MHILNEFDCLFKLCIRCLDEEYSDMHRDLEDII